MYAALFPLRHMKDGKISSYLMKNDYMNTLKPAIPALNARKNVDTGKSGNSLFLFYYCNNIGLPNTSLE